MRFLRLAFPALFVMACLVCLMQMRTVSSLRTKIHGLALPKTIETIGSSAPAKAGQIPKIQPDGNIAWVDPPGCTKGETLVWDPLHDRYRCLEHNWTYNGVTRRWTWVGKVTVPPPAHCEPGDWTGYIDGDMWTCTAKDVWTQM